MSGTGIDVVPNLPKCTVPVWTSIPVPAAYFCRCTELTEVSDIGGDVVPDLLECPIPVVPAIYTGGIPPYVPYRTHGRSNR